MSVENWRDKVLKIEFLALSTAGNFLHDRAFCNIRDKLRKLSTLSSNYGCSNSIEIDHFLVKASSKLWKFLLSLLLQMGSS